jgi:hypothetical protein
MAGDDRGLAGELDVAYSSAEEFGRLVLEWLTEAVRFLAGNVSDEILAGPPLKPYWHKGVLDEGDPRFALRVPPLWGDVSILYPPRNMHYAKPYSRTSLSGLADDPGAPGAMEFHGEVKMRGTGLYVLLYDGDQPSDVAGRLARLDADGSKGVHGLSLRFAAFAGHPSVRFAYSRVDGLEPGEHGRQIRGVVVPEPGMRGGLP